MNIDATEKGHVMTLRYMFFILSGIVMVIFMTLFAKAGHHYQIKEAITYLAIAGGSLWLMLALAK